MKYPIYNCHKQVEAFQIAHITAQAKGTHDDNITEPLRVPVPREDGTVDYLVSAQKTEYVLVDKTGEFVAVVDDAFMERNPVHTGGYFVRYQNGHESFSPRDVFEDGYSMPKLKRILHIKAGSETWEPTLEDMQAILDMFISANADPEGAIVVTNQWIDSTVEKVLHTEEYEITVTSVVPAKGEEKPTVEPSVIWWETHIWPVGVELPKRDQYEIHLNNVQEQARGARGRSVSRVVLHGLKKADVFPEMAAAIHNATLTRQCMTGAAVEWEEVE